MPCTVTPLYYYYITVLYRYLLCGCYVVRLRAYLFRVRKLIESHRRPNQRLISIFDCPSPRKGVDVRYGLTCPPPHLPCLTLGRRHLAQLGGGEN